MSDSEDEKKVSKSKMNGSKKRKLEDEEADLQTEVIEPRSSLPPLFMKLSERPAEALDYIGVSFGVTPQLIKFWKRAKFIPVYISQTTSDITEEHSCIMIHKLNPEGQQIEEASWLQDYWINFRMRFIGFLSYCFRDYSSSLALNILENSTINVPAKTLTRDKLEEYLTSQSLLRLEDYSKNLDDFGTIRDLTNPLAKLYFLRKLGSINLQSGQENSSLEVSPVQAVILLGIGLQHKSISDLGSELNLQTSQVLGLLQRTVKKFTSYLTALTEESLKSTLNC